MFVWDSVEEHRVLMLGACSLHHSPGREVMAKDPRTAAPAGGEKTYLSMDSPHGWYPLLTASSAGASFSARRRKCKMTAATFSSTKPPSRETPWQSARCVRGLLLGYVTWDSAKQNTRGTLGLLTHFLLIELYLQIHVHHFSGNTPAFIVKILIVFCVVSIVF